MDMNPLPPTRLRCEYLTDPLGIASSSPRFSWVPEHPGRGANQAAYQVIVSPESAFIEKEVGDYWDSGRVESDKTAGVRYSGLPLWSHKKFYWRVRWWDQEKNVSPYSETASFEMGLTRDQDWKAKWISGKEIAEFRSRGNVTLGESSDELIQAHGFYLRREFEVKDKIRRARVYVCGLGYCELHLNGLKLGDRVLDPAQTDYRKIALYSVYDITDFIKEKNAVAVILGNGRHIKNYGYGPPRMILQIYLERENELTDRVVSDETWKVSTGPLLENGIYSGERYDARLEQAGWDEFGFDDSAWQNAVEVKGTNLSPQLLPPIRVTERLRPVRLSSPQPGVYVADFGQNFSGWVRLRVDGPRETEIRLRHAELIHENGTLNVLPNQNAEATDIFILKGSGAEVLEPRFTYHGFRYVEITGFPGELTADDIEGCFVHTDVERTGNFSCSDSLLNQVHLNIIWSQLSNLMSIPTDCPQRDERQGWLGDAHLSAEEAILNFDMAAFYTKYLEDIRLSQKEDGSLPDVVPPYLEKLYPADPAWGIAYLELAWLMYFYYDDMRILGRYYTSMKKYVDFLAKNADDNIIKKLGKYGDWCPPGSVTPKKTPLELTSTWCYYRAVTLIHEFSKILGRSDDARFYARLAEEIKTSFNAKFLEEDQYAAQRMSPLDKSPNQTSNVLPLYLNMVPPEKKNKVMDRLLDSTIREWDYHLDTGIIGTKYLLDVLTENGYGEVAYRIATQKSYPGWGYMVQEGATTLWERWEKQTGSGMNSHNHIMLGSVDAWFYRAVAGLKCQEPGWKKIIIKPPLFPDLQEAAASVKTIRGDALVSWRRQDGFFELTARIPVGSESEIYVPLLWSDTDIKEGEKIIWRRTATENLPPEISFLKRDGRYVVFSAGSGTYRFVAEKKT
jgi:alpha-L-rhamnosidase